MNDVIEQNSQSTDQGGVAEKESEKSVYLKRVGKQRELIDGDIQKVCKSESDYKTPYGGELKHLMNGLGNKLFHHPEEFGEFGKVLNEAVVNLRKLNRENFQFVDGELPILLQEAENQRNALIEAAGVEVPEFALPPGLTDQDKREVLVEYQNTVLKLVSRQWVAKILSKEALTGQMAAHAVAVEDLEDVLKDKECTRGEARAFARRAEREEGRLIDKKTKIYDKFRVDSFEQSEVEDAGKARKDVKQDYRSDVLLTQVRASAKNNFAVGTEERNLLLENSGIRSPIPGGPDPSERVVTEILQKTEDGIFSKEHDRPSVIEELANPGSKSLTAEDAIILAIAYQILADRRQDQLPELAKTCDSERICDAITQIAESRELSKYYLLSSKRAVIAEEIDVIGREKGESGDIGETKRMLVSKKVILVKMKRKDEGRENLKKEIENLESKKAKLQNMRENALRTFDETESQIEEIMGRRGSLRKVGAKTSEEKAEEKQRFPSLSREEIEGVSGKSAVLQSERQMGVSRIEIAENKEKMLAEFEKARKDGVRKAELVNGILTIAGRKIDSARLVGRSDLGEAIWRMTHEGTKTTQLFGNSPDVAGGIALQELATAIQESFWKRAEISEEDISKKILGYQNQVDIDAVKDRIARTDEKGNIIMAGDSYFNQAVEHIFPDSLVAGAKQDHFLYILGVFRFDVNNLETMVSDGKISDEDRRKLLEVYATAPDFVTFARTFADSTSFSVKGLFLGYEMRNLDAYWQALNETMRIAEKAYPGKNARKSSNPPARNGANIGLGATTIRRRTRNTLPAVENRQNVQGAEIPENLDEIVHEAVNTSDEDIGTLAGYVTTGKVIVDIGDGMYELYSVDPNSKLVRVGRLRLKDGGADLVVEDVSLSQPKDSEETPGVWMKKKIGESLKQKRLGVAEDNGNPKSWFEEIKPPERNKIVQEVPLSLEIREKFSTLKFNPKTNYYSFRPQQEVSPEGNSETTERISVSKRLRELADTLEEVKEERKPEREEKEREALGRSQRTVGDSFAKTGVGKAAIKLNQNTEPFQPEIKTIKMEDGDFPEDQNLRKSRKEIIADVDALRDTRLSLDSSVYGDIEINELFRFIDRNLRNPLLYFFRRQQVAHNITILKARLSQKKTENQKGGDIETNNDE